jgi:general secretion pathway protein F
MSTGSDNQEAIPIVRLVRPRLSADDLLALNEEIAGMARAGLPLDRGLAALAREMRAGRLRAVTADLAADLEAGRTLPEAFARQGNRVPPYYAAVVTAAVRTGRIDQVLGTLTGYTRSMAELRAVVVGALFYPAIVLCFGLILVSGVAFYLVPQLEQTFVDFRLTVPQISQWAFTVCHHPLVFLGPPVLLVFLLFLARFVLRLSAGGRRLWAHWVYMVPLVGGLIRAARLTAFTDLLAILVDHDVPLADAFGLAGAAASDPLTQARSQLVEADLRRGLPLAEAVRVRRALPDVAAWMTGLGERRGNLAESLRQVAQLYRRQAEVRANLLRTLLPALFVIGTALAIGVVFVTAIFLPLIRLMEALGLRL